MTNMRMNYLKLIQNLNQDLKERLNDFESVKFFRKDIISYLVEILILYFNTKINTHPTFNIILNDT